MTAIDAAAMMRIAEEATGLSDWGGETFFEPAFRQILDVMVRDVREAADLTDVGLAVAATWIGEVLSARLEFVDDRRRHPDLDQERIVAPLFITGLPRSGTTFLHGLIAQDPRNHAPRTFEMLFPRSRPILVDGVDPRIERARAMIGALGHLEPDLQMFHPFGEIEPEEDHMSREIMLLDDSVPAMWRMPSYMRLRSQLPPDLGWAVQHQVMQSLQHIGQQSGTHDRLLLKHPGHVFDIPRLLKAYPDARIVHTHRDPAKVMPSVSAFVLALRSKWSRTAPDPVKIARGNLKAFQSGLDSLINLRADPSVNSHFVDIHFRDLIADPIGAVERIYAAFGIDLTQRAREAMLRWLDDTAQRTPRGKHKLEAFGLDRSGVHAAFARYIDHYGIALEGV